MALALVSRLDTSRGPDAVGGEAADEGRAEEELVDDAQVAAAAGVVAVLAEALDVTTLDPRDTDDVLQQLVIVAGITRGTEVPRVAAKTGEVGLALGTEARARVLRVVEGVVVVGQARERRDRLALRFLDRERRLTVALAEELVAGVPFGFSWV